MSRQEKKTRMRMLPPRVQLQQRDALTGSYPTNVRFSTDGRTGKYPINFDDTTTLTYGSDTLLNYLADYVIHYQRFSNDEYIGQGLAGQEFFQTYVGTPYNEVDKKAIRQTNALGINSLNEMVVEYGLGDSWPYSIEGPAPGIKAPYFNTAAGYSSVAYVDADFGYASVALNKAFSISAWIYPENVAGDEYPIALVGKDNAYGSPGISWQLLINDEKLELRIYDLGSAQTYMSAIQSGVEITSFGWNHVCATYDGTGASGIELYVNGIKLSKTTAGVLAVVDFDTESLRLAQYRYEDGVNPIVVKNFTGMITEVLYIGKVLTSEEVNFVKRATENGTSIVSYREDNIPVSSEFSFLPGIGLGKTSRWLQQPDAQDVAAITGSTINTWGNITSQVVDELPFIHYTPGQELTPFRDSDQPAVDGKSTNNPFYATGSAITDVGEGFDSPLWSKNKIEIDIGVAAPCSATLFLSGANWGSNPAPITSYNKSYEMLYYNFDQKIWQGVGKGIPYGFCHTGAPAAGIVPFENDAMFAFAPSIVNLFGDISNNFRTQVTGVFEWQASAGQPFTNLGFPYHPKYHATGSQTLNMSNYINEPFLIEKIVVELSAAYTIFAKTYNTASYNRSGFTITSITQSTIPASINNIFILNQRRPINFKYSERMEYANYDPSAPLNDCLITASLPINYQLSPGNTITYVDTVRDIITWGGISSFAANMLTSSFRSGIGGTSVGQVFYASIGEIVLPKTENPKQLMTRECVFSSSIQAHNDLSPLSWNGRVYMELPAKSPIRIDRNAETNPINPPDNMFSYYSAGGGVMDLKYSGGGRNALGIVLPNGRNYVTPVATIQENGKFKNSYSLNKENILVTDKNRYRYNPYILLPTDNLIIGWQQPIMNSLIGATSNTSSTRNSISGSFSEIKFLPGPAKVTLYGSYIREGREYNDGTNQLLSSDSVHEVIE